MAAKKARPAPKQQEAEFPRGGGSGLAPIEYKVSARARNTIPEAVVHRGTELGLGKAVLPKGIGGRDGDQREGGRVCWGSKGLEVIQNDVGMSGDHCTVSKRTLGVGATQKLCTMSLRFGS